MWPKNALFIALCAAGLSALAGGLTPVHREPRNERLGSAAGTAGPNADEDENVRRVADQIDDAFRAEWAKAGLTPAPPGDELTTIRRLSLGLMGTIPSLQEIRQFERDRPSGRLDRWLDALLSDRRSHDYLAERLARAFVGVQDGPPITYRRRRFVSWLSDQLHADRAYDEIVRELIADSGLWTDRPATNFITATVKANEKDADEAELATRVSRAFLGVRLDCAECHDHPFQPWKQGDFHGLAAFFGQTRTTFTGIVDADGEYTFHNQNTGEQQTVAPSVPFNSQLLPAEGTRRQQLAAWVTNPANRAFGRAVVNRFWAELFGRPLVEPIDDLAAASPLPPAIDILAADFVEHGHDLRRLIRIIAKTEAFRLDSRGNDGVAGESTPEQEAAWSAFPITRLRPEQAIGGLLQSASLTTIDASSHILLQLARSGAKNEFITRYGDLGEEEFSPQGGTIPQRLLMMNGKQLQEHIGPNVVTNASTQIAMLAPSDEKAVETAYLAVLTRRPTTAETSYFVTQLADKADARSRGERLEDLYWCLLNSTEFSWNH